MLNIILIVLWTISLIFGGHEQVALENLALREQLGIFQRSVRHPEIRQRDRLFWVCLQKVWKQWRSAFGQSRSRSGLSGLLHEGSPSLGRRCVPLGASVE